MSSPSEDVAEVFEELGSLEKEFAEVELDILRRKEFSLRPLYFKRNTLIDRIPDFWPTVFGNGPEEIQQFFSPADLALISSLKSFSVERYQIESETKGEPRSLRFTFEFAENEFIENRQLVKDFEYKPREDGPGSLVSKPVPIKWKGKQKDVTHGLLDAAVELYSAEEALKLKNGEKRVDMVERESLWQHEKLREKMIQLDESPEKEASFFNWFGFRGAVNTETPQKSATNGATGAGADADEEDEDEVEEMLEVEIFPAGEELAISLAEELWTDAMDYFMSAQDEAPFDSNGFEIEEDEDDEEVPELSPAVEDQDDRPRKRQRKD
ncbi:uncharacterized protein Z518_00328 [Rhinocladiella mackenziei CBS 650.93]|uniref:Rhinocladiella mackenziei CBS 650.93 unplaced genomic scaffold supercont1.1, whole genome shotgun sequence n=1 Tax=Rhinocladiella mackenziei CBS 650.93 TaxID=1442369 RepID=A0A0D2IT75_9EURO|nr:uncharacterized protein Z518_00328 [Rhinocladiella mackenziei CBS 650.93]KIX09249.1 hypothetical protein Z518_00328 [Rhinocladiella mackenziei CBS 650.93]